MTHINDDEDFDLTNIVEIGNSDNDENTEPDEDPVDDQESDDDLEASDDQEAGDDPKSSGDEEPSDDDKAKDAIAKELEAKEISKAEETEFSGYVDNLISDVGKLEEQLAQIDSSADDIGEPVSVDPLDHETDAAYQQALVKAAMQNAKMDDLEKSYHQAQKRKAEIRADIWDRQSEVGRKKFKDFDTALNNPTFKPTRSVVEAITSVKNGADVAYHLAKNSRALTKFSRLSPMAVAVEVGRLSASLDKPTKKGTKAPPPVTTVRGSKRPRQRSIDQISISELKKVI